MSAKNKRACVPFGKLCEENVEIAGNQIPGQFLLKHKSQPAFIFRAKKNLCVCV